MTQTTDLNKNLQIHNITMILTNIFKKHLIPILNIFKK